MARYVEFETKIKGGLPVVIKARVHPPEPDVGIFDWQPEFSVFWLRGGNCNIELSDSDRYRIMDECYEEMR